MKKVLFFLALLFAIQTAKAQVNDIYLQDGIVLTDNQWHFDDYSVIEANNGTYLVITPNGHYYTQLSPFERYTFERHYGVNVLTYRPFIYNTYIGWYVQTNLYDLFYCPLTGECVTIPYVPTFYDFYYKVKRLRHLNLRYWHWRNEGRYHHLWRPPQHHIHHHHPHHNTHYSPPPYHYDGNGGHRPPQSGHSVGNGGHKPPQSGNSVGNGGRRPPQSGNSVGNGGHRPPQSGHNVGRGGHKPPQSGNNVGRSTGSSSKHGNFRSGNSRGQSSNSTSGRR